MCKIAAEKIWTVFLVVLYREKEKWTKRTIKRVRSFFFTDFFFFFFFGAIIIPSLGPVDKMIDELIIAVQEFGQTDKCSGIAITLLN